MKNENTLLIKFDVVIGNPPYTNNIHLKFLEKSYDISDRIVYLIHPGSWLYSQILENSNSLKYKSDILKKKYKNHFESFEFINGNIIFDIGLFGPCVITMINKSKTDNTN
jgi:predicted RNA methylase